MNEVPVKTEVKEKSKMINLNNLTSTFNSFGNIFLGNTRKNNEIIIKTPIVNSPSLDPKRYKPTKGLANRMENPQKM
tara:strand:+ start:6252 stop:6482 length:231 start_codon:yes stop_codon:yes gene_type:complete